MIEVTTIAEILEIYRKNPKEIVILKPIKDGVQRHKAKTYGHKIQPLHTGEEKMDV